MSKSKEELNTLKEEVKSVNEEFRELTDEELAQVSGGTAPDITSLRVGGVPVELDFYVDSSLSE